ncbi:uncharacterized protein N7498_002453 [Penicillium cinerascens]|uniref:Uncharacterized protein n=1 Tax=Penicillium cinerascens TaxID=70096 RepID=A0A9W9NA74_9EURO|nr:uncharacterized protein N7498_002453 [Penicillium cinerascens]KAJ5216046.1 hypothetical protein N7498_002453 [Penicillium cinerascens]
MAIEAGPQTEIDRIIARATDLERKHLLDYISYKDALTLVDTEVSQCPDANLKQALETMLRRVSNLEPE